MKQLLCCLCILSATMLLSACHKEHDDLFTEARITMLFPDDIQVERVQATLTLQNINTLLRRQNSNVEGNRLFRLDVLRGSYAVDIEGQVKYRDAQGRQQVSHFRAHSDYVPLDQQPQTVAEMTVDII